MESSVAETAKSFARALSDAKLEGRMLRTDSGSFKLKEFSEIWEEKTFYVRECYKQIADIMLQKKPPVMSLLGSSGIGKSNFMIYLAWRRFHDKELSKFPVFLHHQDVIYHFKMGEEPKEVDAKNVRLAPKEALYIMDADIDVEHGVSCQSLWIISGRNPGTASSNTEHFKIAARVSGEFFMPPWTLEEMLNETIMDLHKVKKEVVEERFAVFGGTARLVLETDEARATKDRKGLEAAVQSPEALSNLKVRPPDMKALSKQTHLLVKMHPIDEFSWFDVNVSSPYVQQQLVKLNRQENSVELWKRMREGMITGIGFALFEEAFHQFMQAKAIGKFKLRARPLTADGTGNDTVVEFNGGLQGVLIYGNPKPDIRDDKYYQPKNKNFPAFDSWTSEGMFQLTVANTHDISFAESGGKATDPSNTQAGKVVVALGTLRDGKARFYFVVPQFQFDNGWRKQRRVEQEKMSDKIEQWAVCFEQNLPK